MSDPKILNFAENIFANRNLIWWLVVYTLNALKRLKYA